MESPVYSEDGSGCEDWDPRYDDVLLVTDDDEATPASTARSLDLEAEPPASTNRTSGSEGADGAADTSRSSQPLASAPSSSNGSIDSTNSTEKTAAGPAVRQAFGFKLNLPLANSNIAQAAGPAEPEKAASRPTGVPALNFQGINSPSGSNGRTGKPPPLNLLVSSSASPAASPKAGNKGTKPLGRQGATAASPDFDSSLPHIEVLVLLPAFSIYQGQQKQQLCKKQSSSGRVCVSSSCSQAGNLDGPAGGGANSSMHGGLTLNLAAAAAAGPAHLQQTPPATAAASSSAVDFSSNSSSGGAAAGLFDPAAIEAAIESTLGISTSGLNFYSLEEATLRGLIQGASESAAAQQQQSSSSCSSPALTPRGLPRPRPISQLSLSGAQSPGRGSVGGPTGLRASSSGKGSKQGLSRTIVVELTSCTFSMSALEDLISSVDQVKAEAKAMQQQHADMEEAQHRELTRAKLDASEQRGELRRVREEYEAMLRSLEKEKQRDQERVESWKAKYEAVK